ncbi:isoprenyl transferase [Lawsonia intracellularis]|uniref:Isoprenyl transferase n=1 Tax=Lawsonia intracellularis (strain PHE/MN1-00) TaxID=363253 RepID=Q1MRD6_LAWIP|nr:isoprenyl transferase [Lawsonia intracellularis]AGC49800.1 undecaprenyl diphosphate synthase [Lawsonia intracellularis N343]KAA0205303.1 isoprenyl transferase [Lawsonia intracellularis]MBZ3892164.1 isoprenyl transferase [Lawsonia intracellularis]OMQ04566.1 di-trans,poly-cis-decaprenylcistransferase [Lawsonia intracellularis]RBN32150.1 isoprenyl transferase [Lawsonia intracellularis]
MSNPIPKHLPSHIAIIMDGNGRWAKQRGMNRTEGHKQGALTAKSIVTTCRKIGIKYLTLYTFSTENWGRPKDEIHFLFQLLVSFLKQEVHLLEENDICLTVYGDLTKLPLLAKKALQHAIARTKHCQSMTVNLAINYSGRTELLYAVKKMLTDRLNANDLNEEIFRNYLYSKQQPDPDLLIRTSGEKRLSNYLIFQTAYSELFFTNTLWPDFTEEELYAILKEYNERNRRFGLTQEQLQQ